MADKFIFKWKPRFSSFRITFNFEFGQFLQTLKSLRVHFALLQLAGALSGNKIQIHLGIIWEVFKWPSSNNTKNMNVHFWIWPIPSGVHNLRRKQRNFQNMNVHLGKWPTQFIFKWKPRFSSFRITYQFWIWPIPSNLKEPPCALCTRSTCWCSQWKQYNTVWRQTINMNVHLGIIWEVFKNGRQIHIQMKA